MARVAAQVQCELYHRLKVAGLEVVPEYRLTATSKRSKRGHFYADIAVMHKGEPIALAECKSRAKELRGKRQRDNYEGCGIPYIVAGANNIDEAVAWLLARGQS